MVEPERTVEGSIYDLISERHQESEILEQMRQAIAAQEAKVLEMSKKLPPFVKTGKKIQASQMMLTELDSDGFFWLVSFQYGQEECDNPHSIIVGFEPKDYVFVNRHKHLKCVDMYETENNDEILVAVSHTNLAERIQECKEFNENPKRRICIHRGKPPTNTEMQKITNIQLSYYKKFYGSFNHSNMLEFIIFTVNLVFGLRINGEDSQEDPDISQMFEKMNL